MQQKYRNQQGCKLICHFVNVTQGSSLYFAYLLGYFLVCCVSYFLFQYLSSSTLNTSLNKSVHLFLGICLVSVHFFKVSQASCLSLLILWLTSWFALFPTSWFFTCPAPTFTFTFRIRVYITGIIFALCLYLPILPESLHPASLPVQLHPKHTS